MASAHNNDLIGAIMVRGFHVIAQYVPRGTGRLLADAEGLEDTV